MGGGWAVYLVFWQACHIVGQGYLPEEESEEGLGMAALPGLLESGDQDVSVQVETSLFSIAVINAMIKSKRVCFSLHLS